MKKIIISLVALLLLFPMLAGGNEFLFSWAADVILGPVYIKDIQIFQSTTLGECVELCEAAGYIPYKKNLNEGAIEKVSFGSDVDAPCVMIGYTTTTNVNFAVTDVSLLRMGEGYEIREFQSIAASLLAKNQNYADGLAAAAADFAENYDKGAPSAVQAYKMLDLLYVDDLDGHTLNGYLESKTNKAPFSDIFGISDTVWSFLNVFNDKLQKYRDHDWSDHTPLGQYILEGNADAEFFNKLLSLATPSILNAVNSSLCAGSAEYENYYDPELDRFETRVWAERLYDSDVREMISEGLTTDEWRSFDSAYMDGARLIASCLQDFATQYLNAKARGASVESLGDTDADDLDGVVEETNDMTDSDLDGVYMATFEILNRYKYDDSWMLGDWVVAAGRRTYSSEADYRSLYAIADALSPSQLVLLRYCGFATFVNNMLQPDEESAESQETFSEIINGLKSLVEDGEEYRVSVWMGVDNSIYYGKVAMTSDAIRQAGANSVLQLTEEEKSAENARIRNMFVSIGTGVITIITIVSTLLIKWKNAKLIKAGVKLGIAAATGMWAGLATFTSFVTKLNLILFLIEIIVTIAIAIYKYVKSELHVPSSEYTDMPSLLFEAKKAQGGVRVVKYNAVTEPYRGRIGDLNAYVGYKWNLLFLSHDSDAGSPLVVPKDSDPFVFKVNDDKTPEGYEPVAQFGQISAADMNHGAYELKNNEKNFLFVATEKSQNGGNAGSDGASGTFIGDLKICSSDTRERAKALITTSAGNYYAFDYNIGTDDRPCYIGYSLTNLEQNAITDIRWFSDASSSSITFGGAEYALAGELPSGGGIFISRSPLVGTPIGSELTIAAGPEDAPEGWEPIVGMSGAPVKLFGNEGSRFAVYFEPKVKYTEGELYVGGFSFFQTDFEYLIDNQGKPYGKTKEELSRESEEEMLSVLRWQKGGIALDYDYYTVNGTVSIPDGASLTRADLEYARDLASGMSHSGIKTYYTGYSPYYYVHEYLVYSLTYNPYRAIRDVTLYTSTPSNYHTLFSTLSKDVLFVQNGVEKTAVGSYAVCDDYLTATAREIYDEIYGESTVRSSHAFVARDCMEDGVLSSAAAHEEYGAVYNWRKSRLLMRGLYVLGPVEGMDPIKASDVVLSGVRSDGVNDDGNIGTVLPEGTYTLTGQSAAGETFRSVQDIKYPYFEKAQNLAYPEIYDFWDADDVAQEASEPLFIYLRGTVRKPKYISSVTVGTYTEDRFKKDNPDANSSMVDYMNDMSEDNAWRIALAGSSGEIITTNLLVPEEDAWYSALRNTKKSIATTDLDRRCSYIGVSRTDDVSKAICGLLLVKKEAVEPGSAPITEIVVGGTSSILTSGSSGTGTTYYLAQGTDSIPLPDGDYYLYYSYNPASVPGVPITDVTADASSFSNAASTVLTSNERGKEAKIFGNTNVAKYIHTVYERTEGSLFNAFYIGVGDNLDAALLDLMAQGATEAAPVDVNQGAGGAVAIGWRMMNVTDEDITLHERSKGKTSDPLREAIRDILFTVDEPYRDTLIKNGVVYKPVSRKSLNEGVEGSVIYMYTCTDYDTWAYNIGKSASEKLYVPSMYSDFASPLTRVGLGRGDRVPYNSALEGAGEGAEIVRWENVISTDGGKVDLNRGAILTTEDGHNLLENRVYLFAHRADDSVKKGAEITGGFVADTETVGALVGKGE